MIFDFLFSAKHVENQMLIITEELDPPFLSHALTGGKKRSIPFRRQRMQIDELVPPSAISAYPVSQPDDPYVADLLQLADGRSVFLCDSGRNFLMDVLIVDAYICVIVSQTV